MLLKNTKNVSGAGKHYTVLLIMLGVILAGAALAEAAPSGIRITNSNLSRLYLTDQASYLCYATGRPIRSQLAELAPRSSFTIGGRFSTVSANKRRGVILSGIRRIRRTLANPRLSQAKRTVVERSLILKRSALTALDRARERCRYFNPALCRNGLQDRLELGIDCGGQCRTRCALPDGPEAPASSSTSSSESANEQSSPSYVASSAVSLVSSSSSSDISPPRQCGDGLDNDHDGLVDNQDPGCGGDADDNEASRCDDYKIFDSIEGGARDAVSLRQYNFTENQAVFLYEGEFGQFPRRFCYQGVCADYYGVIPQAGIDNLSSHLEALRRYVERAIPDPNYRGWVVLDIEAYSPFSWSRTGFPRLDSIYKTLSRNRVAVREPSWTSEQVERAAEDEFNQAALRLLVESLRAIRAVRPQAKLALYGYPASWIYDRSWGYSSPIYGNFNRDTNDLLEPLWNELDGYAPLFYQDVPLGWRYANGDVQTYDWSTYWIESAMAETARLQARFGFKDIVPIVWYRHLDAGAPAPYRNQLMSISDLEIQLFLPRQLGASGVIVWGNEVDPWGAAFSGYVHEVMGPLTRQFCASN